MIENTQNAVFDLTTAPDVSCDDCNGVYFQQVIRIKKISPLVSPNGQAMKVPIQLVQCLNCGVIDESLMAPE